MTYTPQIGHHVIVADKANFYNGREAVVQAVTFDGCYTVAVGSVSFVLTRRQIRELKYAEA